MRRKIQKSPKEHYSTYFPKLNIIVIFSALENNSQLHVQNSSGILKWMICSINGIPYNMVVEVLKKICFYFLDTWKDE